MPQLLIAIGLVGAAVILHYGWEPFWPAMVLWFGFALVIGLLLGRWWAILLAAVPWPVGVGIGLATGRYLYLAEAWWAVMLLSMAIGAVGIALGIGIRQRLKANNS